MTIKASRRSALILATGLFVCLAGPSQAAEAGADATPASKLETAAAPGATHKYARHGTRHWKKYAHRRYGKIARKSAADRTADASDNAEHPSAIPLSVANANAQLTSADSSTGIAAKALPARAGDIPPAAPDSPADARPAADAQVVSADQLNDVDRALHESPPPASTAPASGVAVASAETPAAPVAAVPNESSAWDQTSLIGKIFIGFGALLTMASAARMFMA
jgi:hypothetical protein